METGNQNNKLGGAAASKVKMMELSGSWPTACEIKIPLRNRLYAIRHGEVGPLGEGLAAPDY